MPDEEVVVGNVRLDVDRAKQVALLLAFVALLSFVILVIDWKIKQSILDAAKEVRKDLDSVERWYWKDSSNGASKLKDYTGGLSAVREYPPAGNHGVGGNAGMEEATPPDEDTSSSWSREAIDAVSRIDRSAGSSPLEVPEGD